MRVRGGTRQDALRFVAGLAGVPLDNKPLARAEKQRWARERRELERELPAARYWRRSAVCLTEELLGALKSVLFDATRLAPEIGEIFHLENLLASLRRIDGLALVAEFHWWMERYPGLAAAMVASARRRARADRRALRAYLGETAPAAEEAAA
jgi:hypothetical protein